MTETRRLRAALDELPRYAFDQQGAIYGPVDAGEGTFVRHEDLSALLSEPQAAQPQGFVDANARMREPKKPVAVTEAQRPIADWLKAHGFIEDRYVFATCWSTRSGIDFTDLEFYPWANEEYPSRFTAIIGHHESGTNPRTQIGDCDTLSDVQMVCETIRLINGYQQPEPMASPVLPAPPEAGKERG